MQLGIHFALLLARKLLSFNNLAQQRASMLQRTTAATFLPKQRNIAALREAAKHCEGCDLYSHSIQTVFGWGSPSAKLVFVGDMPSDEDDREGEPFVGPVGWLIDSALEQAGIARSTIYITNIVKHFRWIADGTHRASKRPSPRHIAACRPWLEAEFQLLRPYIVVCLGATAAQFFFGAEFRIHRDRGQVYSGPNDTSILATYHPRAILKAPKREQRDRMHQLFVDDLRAARDALERVMHAVERGDPKA